jgi:hypothetical protein
MKWKKGNGNHFAMLWTNQIERSLMRCLISPDGTILIQPIPDRKQLLLLLLRLMSNESAG